MLAAVGAGAVALCKRMIHDDYATTPELKSMPWYAVVIIILDLILLLPLCLAISYTVGSVFPVLTIVENPDPNPAYSALASNDSDNAAVEGQPLRKPDNASLPGGGVVTNSLRATVRHLYSLGGLRSFLRGALALLLTAIASSFIFLIVAVVPFIPSPVGSLVADLALVQLQTVWVHMVISARSPSPHFWRRLPPFGKTFQAVKYPILICWVAETVSSFIAYGINAAFGGSSHADGTPNTDNMGWRILAILLSTTVCIVLFWLPAFVVLVRVQASLLPPDEDTIVAFDRSFGGRVEPSVVDGRGYVSVKDALCTFSRACWIRLYKMYIKGFLVNVAVGVLVGAVLVLQNVFLHMVDPSS